jgi:hypothetical protein
LYQGVWHEASHWQLEALLGRAVAEDASLRGACPPTETEQHWWEANRPRNIKDVTWGASNLWKAKLNGVGGLSRAFFQRALAAATGYGDFQEYHERFGYDPDSYRGCPYGAPKIKEYWKDCPVREHLRETRGSDRPIKVEFGKRAVPA